MKRFAFPLALLMLVVIGVVLFKPLMVPIRFGGDNAENYRDTVDRNTFATIFDPFLITTSRGANTYYCPMQSIAWLFLAHFAGFETAYYRMFALLIHLICALLAAGFARSLYESDWAGFFAGAAFLVFAPHGETLKFVSAVITHGLCVAFYLAGLLSFLRYLRGRKLGWYFLTLGFFVLAHLSKETAWSMLPVMMAIEFFVFLSPERKKPTFDNLVSFANKYFPFAFVLLGAMTIFVLKYPYGNISQGWGGASMSINVLFRFFDIYTMLLLPVVLPASAKLILVNLVLFGGATLLFIGPPKLRLLFFWTVVAILPYCLSNFRPAWQLTRYLYLASAPFATMLVWPLVWAKEKKLRIKWLPALAPVGVIAFHLILSIGKIWG